MQSATIPFCVGTAVGVAVVLDTPVVRVGGVPGIPTHRYSSAFIPSQSDPTVGFHSTKSSLEKPPNMLTISSHVSDPSTWYQEMQVMICSLGIDAGRVVCVGGEGKKSAAATQ